MLDNMGKSASFDRFMSRNGEFQQFIASVFMEPNMASFLPDDTPPIPLKSADYHGV